MNKELLLKVADAIENEVSDLGFDMAHFRLNKECGTTACIAGHAVFIHDAALFKDKRTNIERAAIKALDLTNDARAIDLFYHNRVPRKKAAAVIRHLVATDLVTWGRAKRAAQSLAFRWSGRYSDGSQGAQIRDDCHVVALEDNFDCPSIVGVEVIPTSRVIADNILVEDVPERVSAMIDEVY
jgi:hypothetical protein